MDDASCGPWVPKQNLQLNRLIHGIFETFGILIERLLDLRIFYLQIMGVLSVDLLTSFKFKNGKIYRTYCGFFFLCRICGSWLEMVFPLICRKQTVSTLKIVRLSRKMVNTIDVDMFITVYYTNTWHGSHVTRVDRKSSNINLIFRHQLVSLLDLFPLLGTSILKPNFHLK